MGGLVGDQKSRTPRKFAPRQTRILILEGGGSSTLFDECKNVSYLRVLSGKYEFVEWQAWNNLWRSADFGASGLETTYHIIYSSSLPLIYTHLRKSSFFHRCHLNHPFSCLINRSHPRRSRQRAFSLVFGLFGHAREDVWLPAKDNLPETAYV